MVSIKNLRSKLNSDYNGPIGKWYLNWHLLMFIMEMYRIQIPFLNGFSPDVIESRVNLRLKKKKSWYFLKKI